MTIVFCHFEIKLRFSRITVRCSVTIFRGIVFKFINCIPRVKTKVDVLNVKHFTQKTLQNEVMPLSER